MTPASARLGRGCRLLGAVVLALFMVTAFTPAPNLLAARLAVRPAVAPADAIMVLGVSGKVWDDGLLGDVSLRRALRGILLYRAGLAPLLVFSGTAPEIAARVELARALGVPAERILSAPGANTTREEAARLRALLPPARARRILLVTDPQHMIRARRLFERAGFGVLPATADQVPVTAARPEERLELVRSIMGEILARLYYRAAGYL